MPDPNSGHRFVGWRLVVRQLVTAPSVALTVFTSVLIAGMFIVGTPLFLETLSERALLSIVTEADPAVRNLRVSRATTIPVLSGEGPFERAEAFGAEFLTDEAGAELEGLVREVENVFESPRFAVDRGPDGALDNQTFVSLLVQSNAEEHLRLIDGRLPGLRDPALSLAGAECDELIGIDGPQQNPAQLRTNVPPFDCEIAEVPLFEAAFSAETLREMGLEVGDRVSVSPDPTDLIAFGGVPGSLLEYQVLIEVSGVIAPVDGEDEYWYGDVSLHRPRLVENPDFEIVYATGIAAPEAYRSMLTAFRPANWRYTWRYFIETSLLDPSDARRVQAETRALQAGFPPSSPFSPGQPEVSTGLAEVIETFFEQRRLAYSALAISGAGVFVTAVAVVLLMAALGSGREAESLILIRSRGASSLQVVTTKLAGGVLVIAPAVMGAYLTSRTIAGTRILEADLAAVALMITGLGAFTASVLPFSQPPLGDLMSRGRREPKGSLRRVVAEVFVVIAAIGATLVVMRRFEAGPQDRDRFDVMLALAPVVLGVATGIVTIRLLDLPIRAVAWIASRLRGAVVFVALRRTSGMPTVVRLPLIAVIAAVAMSVFAAVLQTSIIEGQVESTFYSVGADYTVTARAPGDQLAGDYGLSRHQAVDAVAEAARVRVSAGPSLAGETLDSGPVELIAVGVSEYMEVTAETNRRLIPSLEPLTGPTMGNRGVPALISLDWPGLPAVGTELSLTIGGSDTSFIVGGFLDRFPRSPNMPFLVVDLTALEKSLQRNIPTTDLYVKAPADAEATIADEVSSRSSNAVLMSQREELDRARNGPFVRGVLAALLVASGLAWLFGVIAAIGALALTGPGRRRDLGYLRTVGLTSRQALVMTATEMGPLITIAAIVGGLLGVLLSDLFEPALGLVAFTGGGVTQPIKLRPLLIALVTGSMIMTFVLAVVLFAAAIRRRNLGQLLRVGDD